MVTEPATLGDFFLCELPDPALKSDLGSLEHPIFSLATRPDRRVMSYSHNDIVVTVTPSVRGRATIHDKDVLIYCTSQLIAALNAGQPVCRTVYLVAHDLLKATGRDTSGDGYRRLRDALERLVGTRITTNLKTGPLDDPVEVTTGFGLIEAWQIVRKTRAGRMVSVQVTLSEWLYRAILSKSVLTLNRQYFNLRRPLERRIYELARKHCGRQDKWRVSLEVLQKKSGSGSPRRVFRAMLRDIIANDALPDYSLTEEPGDMLQVSRRVLVETLGDFVLRPETLDTVRTLAPGADVYALEAEWRAWWVSTGQPVLRSADRAFIGWVSKRSN